MASGIYQLQNTVTEMIYIGSAVHLERRKEQHFRELRNGNHRNSRLQKAFVEHGESAFTFAVVEVVTDKTKLIEREQAHIDHAHSYNPRIGYNICAKAGSSLGVRRSEETKEKCRQSHLGKTLSPEHRRKLSVAGKGRNLADWHREKLIASRPEKHSDATRLKMSLSHIGKTIPEEQRRKLGEASRRVQKDPVVQEKKRAGLILAWKRRTPEERAAIARKSSESQKGKIIPAEQRKKISASLTGKKQSEETKKKRSETMRGNSNRRDHFIRMNITEAT